jgi:hypothetical protein
VPRVEHDEEPSPAGHAPGPGRVTCRYTSTASSNDREARALRRWRLTRLGFWVRWVLTWVVFVAAVLVGVVLLVRWLAPEAEGYLSWAVLLGGGMMLAAVLVDAATLPQRTLRRLQRVVERLTPVGTPVEQSFSAESFQVTTPTTSTEVPTASVTVAAWVRDCLVLEGTDHGAWVMNGDGIDDRAFQVVLDALGDRLRQS